MKRDKRRAAIICDLIQAFDPYGMSDLTPELCDDRIGRLLADLCDYYVAGGLIEKDDQDFTELYNTIKSLA